MISFTPTNPIRFYISSRIRRLARHTRDLVSPVKFAEEKIATPWPHVAMEHSSPIYRMLDGVPIQWMHNKRDNLRLACPPLHGLVVAPEEVFSFWRHVREASAARGFKTGLVIHAGKAAEGMGGGLCQLSNALFWMALHFDCEIIERHRHSFDIFPDCERQVPCGLGATVSYGLKDLRFANSTQAAIQLWCNVTDEQLIVQFRSQQALAPTFEVAQLYDRFEMDGEGRVFRCNQVARRKRGSNDPYTMLYTNRYEVRYAVPAHRIVNVS